MVLKIDGLKFGRLQAVRKLGSVNKQVVWRFLCECGTEIDLPATRVSRGHTQSCGCIRVEASRDAVARDVLGHRFGKLLVTDRLGSSGGRIQWRCVCDCGNEVVRSSKNIVNGTATSCGCVKRAAGLANVKAREVDLTGLRFGMLVVAEEHSRPKAGVKLYRCVCDCGGERVSRHGDIQGGKVVSCGCAERGPHVDPMMTEHARQVCAAAGATRRARKRQAGGKFTAEQINALMKKQRGCCANCGAKLGEKFHRDHRVALSAGGTNDIGNIELLCAPCNLRKHDKDPIDWAQENGRLI